MTPFVLLIPFVLAVAVSVVSRKACYGIIIGSSVLLAGYALGGAVPGTLAFFFVLSSPAAAAPEPAAARLTAAPPNPTVCKNRLRVTPLVVSVGRLSSHIAKPPYSATKLVMF